MNRKKKALKKSVKKPVTRSDMRKFLRDSETLVKASFPEAKTRKKRSTKVVSLKQLMKTQTALDRGTQLAETLFSSHTDVNEPEQINHPSHYGGDVPYEVIKVLEAWEKMFPNTDFKILTAICYLPRAGAKDPNTEITDLEKAVWYIQRKIDQLKAKKGQ